MQRPSVTTRLEYARGLFALFLLGLIGAACGLIDRTRGLVPAGSHNAQVMAVERGQIRYDR